MFLLPAFGLFAANKYADDRDNALGENTPAHEGEAWKTHPFDLPQTAFQRGNMTGARFPRMPNYNATQQPIKYDPPGQVGAGRSALILRDPVMASSDWRGVDNMSSRLYFRDIPFTGWNNSSYNWRIQPQARSWPRTEIGAEFHVPRHFDPHTGSGFGDWDHTSVLGAQHSPKEIFSHGPLSTTTWAYMDGVSRPHIMRQLD